MFVVKINKPNKQKWPNCLLFFTYVISYKRRVNKLRDIKSLFVFNSFFSMSTKALTALTERNFFYILTKKCLKIQKAYHKHLMNVGDSECTTGTHSFVD